MGFNSAFKGLKEIYFHFQGTIILKSHYVSPKREYRPI